MTVSPSASASASSRTAVPGWSSSREAARSFGKYHRLELAGWVGEGDEGVRIAALAIALSGGQHGAGKRAHDAACASLGRKIGPGIGAERLQHVLIVIEGVAGEKEADRLELARQPIGRHPGLAARSSIGGGRAGSSGEEVFWPSLASSRERLPAAMMRSTLA